MFRLVRASLFLAVFAALAVGCDGQAVVGGRSDASTDMGPLPCPTGQLRCDGRCVDVTADRANCGACGTACAEGQVCTAGGAR
ncbi:MAG: hypothetical protein U0326_04480 [Polyangiales bacterium]